MIGVFARHVHLSRRQDQNLLCLLTFSLIATVDLSECCGTPTEISDPSISCCHPENTCMNLNNLPSTRWRQSTTPRQPCRETVCVLTYPSQEMLTICRVQREATAWECSANDRLLLNQADTARDAVPIASCLPGSPPGMCGHSNACTLGHLDFFVSMPLSPNPEVMPLAYASLMPSLGAPAVKGAYAAGLFTIPRD